MDTQGRSISITAANVDRVDLLHHEGQGQPLYVRQTRLTPVLTVLTLTGAGYLLRSGVPGVGFG